MEAPEIRYVRAPEGAIAYQVLGDAPVDLVFLRPWPMNLDLDWEQPAIERFYRRLGSFARVIIPDAIGGGLSDPLPGGERASTELYVHVALRVLDDVGSERAVLVGIDPPATFACWLAAARPDRVAALVMIDPAPKFVRTDDYEWGMPSEVRERFIESNVHAWGTGEALRWQMGGRDVDEALVRWYARLERGSFSPVVYGRALRGTWFDTDLRGVLASVACPTLIISHTEHPYIRPEHSRYIAERIPDAKLIERRGPYATWWIDDVDTTLDEIEAFVSDGTPAAVPTHRVLSTVLFTDIVGSTERAAELGDARWREVLDLQDSVFRRALDRFGGRLVKTAGDGLLATFDGPARAIRCGSSIRDMMRSLDLEIRTGVHTGEIELRGNDIGGLAVHVGARVMAAADSGGVMVTSIVKDLVGGSGISFEDRGVHALKGVPDEWRLYAVTGA